MESAPAGSILTGLTAVVVLVALNAFFVAAEFALVGSRRTRLEELAQAGDRQAGYALRIIAKLPRYISTTQVGITVCSLALGWIGEPAMARLIRGGFARLPPYIGPLSTSALASVVAFTAISFTLIIVGEMLPKAMALLHPERVGRLVAWPLMGFAWVLAVPAVIVNASANRLLRLIRIDPTTGRERVHSPEEIRMLVEQSQEGGTLGKEDARMLEGVFEFSEKTAQEVMTPRTQMVGLERELTVEQAADEVAAARRSRYPVYTESLDDIVGVVHAKDILTALRSRPGETVGAIMRPPLFVPGTREVEDVLADMKRLKVHLAIVLDEYGGTAGLVTMEDLLEEIVGDIFDEYDRQERAPKPETGAPLLDGSLAISDFNTQNDRELDDSEYTTLGGYLFGQLGRLPRVGDRVTAGPDVFEIAEMEGRRVKLVRYLAGTGARAG
jgi:CBS domain containing-hemolysin-like protein